VASEEGRDADVPDAVVSLVAKSLVSTRAIGESTYYRLLDITRAHAQTKLTQRGELDSIARRHAIFYARFLQDEKIIQSRFGELDLSAFGPHIGNVRAALDWALSDHGDVTIGIALAASAAPLSARDWSCRRPDSPRSRQCRSSAGPLAGALMPGGLLQRAL
jgi:predicted ATPase